MTITFTGNDSLSIVITKDASDMDKLLIQLALMILRDIATAGINASGEKKQAYCGEQELAGKIAAEAVGKGCSCEKHECGNHKCEKKGAAPAEDKAPAQTGAEAYTYPAGLAADTVAALETAASDSEALLCGEAGVAHGKKIYSYSRYEVLFMCAMSEAGFNAEGIYREFAKNPYCMKRSLSAVRTRLSMLKKGYSNA